MSLAGAFASRRLKKASHCPASMTRRDRTRLHGPVSHIAPRVHNHSRRPSRYDAEWAHNLYVAELYLDRPSSGNRKASSPLPSWC